MCSPPITFYLFLQQPDRYRHGYSLRHAGRRAGGLRHRAHESAQIGDRDLDRAHYTRALVSHSTFPFVSVARPSRHPGPRHYHLVVTVPIVIWIMIGYFETTPLELGRRRSLMAPRAGRSSGPWRCQSHDPAWRSLNSCGDLLLEQFRVWHCACRTRDADAARSCLQHDFI